MDVAKTFICNSVRPRTKRTYCTGEKRWIAVAEQIGTDSLMRVVPDVWARRTDSMRDSSLTWTLKPPSHQHWLQQRQHVRSHHGFMHKFMSPKSTSAIQSVLEQSVLIVRLKNAGLRS
jgi:hypothetical protein